MKQWEAQVRVTTTNNQQHVIRTRVFADTYYAASLLLVQQYGKANLITAPRQISGK